MKSSTVYDTSTTSNVVVLNTIHIDIMDYILPATCTDTEFRQMWQDFEWENKVSVNTTLTDLHEYLRHLLKSTNMKCLTPEKALSGQCGFMAANMYARYEVIECLFFKKQNCNKNQKPDQFLAKMHWQI